MLIIDTGYPNGIYKIAYVNRYFFIKGTNGGETKISNREQTQFMHYLLNISLRKIINRKYFKLINKKIFFKDCFVCLEDFRNIHYNIINNLINDNSESILNKIGSFGFLAGKSKPYRLQYIKLCEEYPDLFEYISTNKYSPDDKTMLSFNYFKKYKYLIDLPGHTYSTKLYAFLHCKRIIFRLKNINKQHEYYWEKYLKPNIHYIEIENDFSDIIEKYNYLENNPNVISEILNNCNILIQNELSQDNLLKHFLNIILK